MKKFLFGAFAAVCAAFSLAAVNINTASSAELEALPGIGPAKGESDCGIPSEERCVQIGGGAEKREGHR